MHNMSNMHSMTNASTHQMHGMGNMTGMITNSTHPPHVHGGMMTHGTGHNHDGMMTHGMGHNHDGMNHSITDHSPHTGGHLGVRCVFFWWIIFKASPFC